MLTSADDYPLHQTPEPIAVTAGSGNFYDRYFFNGYSEDGETFFAAAMGFYPEASIVDAAFSVQRGGIQHNVRASKRVDLMDRMDLSVGPISIAVIEPLKALQVQVDHEVVQANVEFTARCPAVQEPRFTLRSEGQLIMDYTRMTQNGTWQGDVAVEGRSQSIEGLYGTRDRSWGIRPIGRPAKPESTVQGRPAQFFWVWAPLNFESFSTLYHLNADGDGNAWNESGSLVPLLSESATGQYRCDAARSRLKLAPDRLRLGSFLVDLEGTAGPWGDGAVQIAIEPKRRFYMSGLGYTHPEWGHGCDRGPLDVGYDQIELESVDETNALYRHVQALCSAQIVGTDLVGCGVVEQLFIGAYAPLGLGASTDDYPARTDPSPGRSATGTNFV